MRLNKITALLISSIVIVTSNNFVKASTSTSSTSAYRSETYRPRYHFTPDIGWMNDPNGMVYYHGVYHLFYQYNPYDTVWGPMHWGHAESKDMINWTQEPIALAPDANGDIFSGSIVVDWNNSSGLFNKTSDYTGLVALYTTNSATTGQQYQSMAYSTDDGKTWTKYDGGKAIIAQPANTPNFRDPKVSWDNVHNKWVMVIAAGDQIQFYSSNNLKDWTRTGEFGAEGQASHAGVWECPDLYQMTVSGHNVKKWVLSINLGSSASPDSPPAGGSGMMYVVGAFDGSKFIADPKFTVTNNIGASDTVKGYYLLPGDIINVYDAQTGGNMLGTATVAAGQSTATVNLTKDLGSGGGKIWISITNNRKEETRLESDYFSEVASANSGTGTSISTGATAVAPVGEDITNPDFETGDLTGWTVTGNAWSNKSIVDNTTWGGAGKYHCSSYTDTAMGGVGDPGTGTLESTVFTLGGNGNINFLIAGGDLPKSAYVTLEDATTGKELTQFNASGESSATVRMVNWDASAYLGKKLRIKVVDNATGGWGHIDVDNFHVYNTTAYQPPANQLPTYPVNWIDYGPDFYAGVTWNDTTPQTNATTAKYGKYVPDGRRILLGWMSNWAYADQTPTTTWRSADSIPREEKLVATNDGYKITQQPIRELSSIEKTATEALTNTTINKGNTVSLGSESTYEITSTFNIASTTSSEFGINVKVGGNQYTTIGYDKATSTLFLNRNNSSSFKFLDYMPNKQEAPLKPDAKGNIKIRILVDKDSVEVFGSNDDNGSVTITDQIFSDNSSNGIKLYSTGGGTKLKSLVVTPLKSVKFTPYVNNSVPNAIPTSDFESGTIPDFWKQTEGYVNTFTVSNATSWWGGKYNQDGKSFLTTWGENGDAASGILKSNYFKLSGNGKISFLIGGGNHPTSEYLALVDGTTGTKLFSATGEDSETLRAVTWDASKYVGKVVYLEIVDENQGGWGHINLDDINVPHFNSNIKKSRVTGNWREIGPYGMKGSSTSAVSNGLYMATQKAKNLIYEAKVSNVTSDNKTKEEGAGLVFGASKDLANAYEFNIDPSKGVARLFNKKDGKDLASEVKKTLSSDKSYQLKVVISGTNIKAYLDGEKVFDINVTAYTGGNVGLDVLNGSADFQDVSFQKLDNLKINLGTSLSVNQTINLGITATNGDNSSNIDISNLDIVYSSNNPTVATVDASGKITGVASGTAIITAKSEGKTAAYLIYVQ